MNSTMLLASAIIVIELFAAKMFTAWFRRSMNRCRSRTDPNLLSYPDCIQPFFVLSVIFLSSFALMGTLGFIYLWAAFGIPLRLFFIFALFSLLCMLALSIYMLIASQNESFRMFPGGFEYRTPFRRQGQTQWSDIVRMRSLGIGWFSVRCKDGDIVFVSYSLCNLPSFAARAIAEVNPTAIDPRCKRLLKRIATNMGWPPFL